MLTYLTYDDIWSTFLDNYKVSKEDVSSTDEAIYNDIRNGVRLYNNRMRTKFECDDLSETVIGATTDDECILIAHYIRLVYLINSKTLYETLYQPISPDVGIKNYNTQMRALESSIERQESFIESVIFNMQEDFL